MSSDLFVRYIHFVSIFVLVAAVLGQHYLLKDRMTRAEVGRLQRLDIYYAISVVIALATGFLQWFKGAKPVEFYSENPIFHVKITLFLLVGLISIYPSVFLGKNRKGDSEEVVRAPALLKWSIRIEILLLLLIPFLATLMARGIGLKSS